MTWIHCPFEVPGYHNTKHMSVSVHMPADELLEEAHLITYELSSSIITGK